MIGTLWRNCRRTVLGFWGPVFIVWVLLGLAQLAATTVVLGAVVAITGSTSWPSLDYAVWHVRQSIPVTLLMLGSVGFAMCAAVLQIGLYRPLKHEFLGKSRAVSLDSISKIFKSAASGFLPVLGAILVAGTGLFFVNFVAAPAAAIAGGILESIWEPLELAAFGVYVVPVFGAAMLVSLAPYVAAVSYEMPVAAITKSARLALQHPFILSVGLLLTTASLFGIRTGIAELIAAVSVRPSEGALAGLVVRQFAAAMGIAASAVEWVIWGTVCITIDDESGRSVGLR